MLWCSRFIQERKTICRRSSTSCSTINKWMSSFVMPHGPLFFKDFLFMSACSMCKRKKMNRNDWIMCVGTCRNLMQVNEFGQRQRGSLLPARGSGCWGHTYCAGRETGSRASYCLGTECLCELHRTDSCWSGLHMRPHSLPHSSILFCWSTMKLCRKHLRVSEAAARYTVA